MKNNQMKKFLNYVSVIVIVFFFINILGCGTGRNVSSFHETKKLIDTLVIVPPYMDIKEIGVKNIWNDTAFEHSASDTISFKIYDFLHYKYPTIIRQKGYKMVDNETAITLNDLNTTLDGIKGNFGDIKIPEKLRFQLNGDYRYYLIVIYAGVFWTEEKFDVDSHNPANASVRQINMLTFGPAAIVPASPTFSGMRVVLADKKDNRILFFNKAINNGALNNNEMDDFVMHNLLKMYYR